MNITYNDLEKIEQSVLQLYSDFEVKIYELKEVINIINILYFQKIGAIFGGDNNLIDKINTLIDKFIAKYYVDSLTLKQIKSIFVNVFLQASRKNSKTQYLTVIGRLSPDHKKELINDVEEYAKDHKINIKMSRDTYRKKSKKTRKSRKIKRLRKSKKYK